MSEEMFDKQKQSPLAEPERKSKRRKLHFDDEQEAETRECGVKSFGGGEGKLHYDEEQEAKRRECGVESYGEVRGEGKLHYDDGQVAEITECGVKSFGEGEGQEEEEEDGDDDDDDDDDEEEEKDDDDDDDEEEEDDDEYEEEGETQELGAELNGHGKEVEEGSLLRNGEKTNSGSPSNKCPSELPIDRLSALPDSILRTILSLLNPLEVAITSVLSRRWQFLWIECPNLVFINHSSRTAEIRKFVDRCHKILAICSGKHLEKFGVRFKYKKSFASDVIKWVKFAVNHKVKCVSLVSTSWNLYKLPQMMYGNSSLTDLLLSQCIVEPRRTIKWGSLTKLVLLDVDLREHAIEKILSACPVLYELTLLGCQGIKSLELKSRHLHQLMISDCKGWNGDEMLLITAPYLMFITVLLTVEGRMLKFIDVSPYIEVNIDLLGGTCDATPLKLVNYTDELLANFERVKILVLGHAFIQLLSKFAVEGWRPPESDVQYLTVKTISDENCIPAIVCVLESSPFLKYIRIEGNQCKDCCSHEDIIPDGISESCLEKFILGRELVHLEEVEIISFANPALAGEPMLRLVQLVLLRAVALEAMKIAFGDFSYTLKDYVKITEQLISYRRASREAVVTIMGGFRSIIRDRP